MDWRKLDNSAKIFPISNGKKYSTVFRLSAVLKEKVNQRILEEAVNIVLEEYKSFKVRMKTGFFWYYLEYNHKKPIIKEEKEYFNSVLEKLKSEHKQIVADKQEIDLQLGAGIRTGRRKEDFEKKEERAEE